MSRTPETRRYLKSIHRCTYCQKRDAYTLNGRSLCADCAEKFRVRNALWRADAEKNARLNAAKVEKSHIRKDAGLCAVCGKPNTNGHYRCDHCLAKCRRYTAKYAASRKLEQGLIEPWSGGCARCKRQPAMDGKKLCQKCYQKNIDNLEKGRQALEAYRRNNHRRKQKSVDTKGE